MPVAEGEPQSLLRLWLSIAGPKIDESVSGSNATSIRASSAGIQDVYTDAALVAASDYILSIAPPRDVLAIAKRIADACRSAAVRKERNRRLGLAGNTAAKALVFIDLNAVSPRTAREVAEVLSLKSDTEVPIQFVDGGIIGGPPKSKPGKSEEWSKPSLVVSGPERLPSEMADVLNLKHVSDKIGQASGLKMCFASLSKVGHVIALFEGSPTLPYAARRALIKDGRVSRPLPSNRTLQLTHSVSFRSYKRISTNTTPRQGAWLSEVW